jgi:hypothetical protein
MTETRAQLESAIAGVRYQFRRERVARQDE